VVNISAPELEITSGTGPASSGSIGFGLGFAELEFQSTHPGRQRANGGTM